MNAKLFPIMNAGELVNSLLDALKNASKDHLQGREKFEEALDVLRRELGNDTVETFLSAVNRRCETDLLFCGNLGYQANLKNFMDPVARAFLDVDYEEYLRVEVLQRMPERQAADASIDAFYRLLNESQKELYNAISSYLTTLELDLTKLAHYFGFVFANRILEYTEPGYSPNYILTSRYKRAMTDWFGGDLGF